ncbi:hypothetical protein HDU82_005797 [Entophlyctis luteolus]|nr:hypothetical protein HDU82_005797 [Entophlyctis luteolus]
MSRNPVSTHYEFMGPHLTPLVVAGLAVLPTLLQSLCAGGECPPRPLLSLDGLPSALQALFANKVAAVTAQQLTTATAVILAWYAWQAVLYLVLPGRVIPGTLIRDGTRLTYPINAFSAMVVSYAALFVICAAYGPSPLLWVSENMIPLCLASTMLSIVESVGLYAASFRTVDTPASAKKKNDGKGGKVPALLALGGNSGYPVYDFFIGRELNPRLFGFDFKYFCELRPGIIGWTFLNAANAVTQGVLVSGSVEWNKVLPAISNSMWLVVAFQIYYMADALWNEPAILTTMDITTDGFGFMLCFGDLVWVPFTYSLQSKYLSMSPVDLSPSLVAAFIVMKLFGLYIFRGSNGQKNAFRTNPGSPECKHLKFIETKRGTKLLVSGWWGIARHINYTGDWLMALSWSVPTGFGSLIPYFYPIYFGILLWHREIRDEHNCKLKYGKDWDRYCAIVKYRFVPGVY